MNTGTSLQKFADGIISKFQQHWGESEEVNYFAAEDYIQKFPDELEEHENHDRVNAGFGLFYRDIPLKSKTASKTDRRGIRNQEHRKIRNTVLSSAGK